MSAETASSDWTQVWVEWDEPGAGGIHVNGERVIHFSVETDWSDQWHPQVSEVGQELLDQLPRLVQERENAYDLAQRLQQDLDAQRALGNGRSSGRDD